MGGVTWLMIRSEVILAWSVEGGAKIGARGRSLSFLHLFCGGQVVAEDSRVALYRTLVVGGKVLFSVYISPVFCGGQVIAELYPSGSQPVAEWYEFSNNDVP